MTGRFCACITFCNTLVWQFKHCFSLTLKLVENFRNINRKRIIKIENFKVCYFKERKLNEFKRAESGGGASLWKAVGLAKDLNHGQIPSDMTLNGIPVVSGKRSESFAKHFIEKINSNVNKTIVNTGDPCNVIMVNVNLSWQIITL